MTSAPQRRLALFGVVALLLAAALGTGAWALAADRTSRPAAPAAAPAPTELAPTINATAPTTAPPATLPRPAPAPADEHAATPDVVYGTLELPTIRVAQDLHEGITLTAIDRGPSHWPGTALPGQAGNVVVAGHRVTHTRPFYDLDRLRPGDPLVFVMHNGTRVTYELTSTEVVSPDAMHIVDQTPEPTATLFACHPKGSAAQRIVAHFRLRAPG